MPLQFLHGAEVVRVETGVRPISTVKSSVIGLTGTAPFGPLNEPTIVASRHDVAQFGPVGKGWTIPDALDAIFDQADEGQVGGVTVVINVADPADNTLYTAVAAAPMQFNRRGQLQLPRPAVTLVTLSAPIKAILQFGPDNKINLPANATAVTAVKTQDGVTTYTVVTDYTFASQDITRVTNGTIPAESYVEVTYTATLTAGADYTLDANLGLITRISGGDIVPNATVQVAYSYFDPTKVTATKILGGVDGATGKLTGVHALLAAKTTLALTPRILIAPGWTHQRPNGDKNAVVAELEGIAGRLMAHIIADGPNTNSPAAVSTRSDFGTQRVFLVDPWPRWVNPATGATEAQPPSARVAGMISVNDNTRGFWTSPSNRDMKGIVGTARPITWALNDTSSDANYLNENEVATIIRMDGGGFRLWGNRTCSIDPRYAFLSVSRTADIIEDSILRAHIWAVDRNITRNYIQDLVDGVQAYINTLAANGAIIGGECWADAALNTPTELMAGRVYINFAFTAAAPAERITFLSELTGRFYADIFAQGDIRPTLTGGAR